MPEGVSAKIEDFFAQYKLRKYTKGQILLLNGDDTNFVYHLVSGKVKQYDVSYRGEEVIINVFKPPAFFPMSLAINKGVNPYIYEAETDIEIRQAPADEVVEFVRDNKDVAFDLLSRVYRGVDGLIGRMVHLMASSAKNRLIYELIIECHRFGDHKTDGSVIITLNEKDLAGRAGLSRETVNREAHKLKQEGLLKVRAHDIVITDLKKLEAALDRDL
jgi:CRP/FNR family transcriptional regulator